MKILPFVAIFAASVGAQSTITICANYASTITYTAYKTFNQTCACSSNGLGTENSTYSFTTTAGAVALPDATIVPSSTWTSVLITEPTESVKSPSLLTTVSLNVSSLTSTTAFTSAVIPSQNPVLSSTVVAGTTILSIVSSSEIQTSNLTIQPLSTASSSQILPVTTQSTLSTIIQDTTSLTAATQSSSSPNLISTPTVIPSSTSSVVSSSASMFPSTTVSLLPVVTDQAYINTVLRHHNIHRLNHTADSLGWSPSLAETARKIASSCRYGHVVDTDGGGYGQNIGAGYYPDQMGLFITEGLYNSEVNNYIYYGMEPNLTTLNGWGHFSQIVWKDTSDVGCYTQDCTSSGLANVGSGVALYFTVCNYAPPGNVIGEFAQNVRPGIGLSTVHQDYGCPTDANCL